MTPCRLAICLWSVWAAAATAGPEISAPADWAAVSAIFSERCLNCHSGPKAARELRLDRYDTALLGSDRGRVLIPGDTAGSELMRRIRGESTPRMPFLSRPLPSEEIEIILRWIEAGLPDTATATKRAAAVPSN